MSTKEEFEEESSVTPLTEEQKALINDNIKLAYFLGHLQYNKMLNSGASRVRTSRTVFTREEVLQFALHGLVAAARRFRDYSQKKGYPEHTILAGEGFSVFARKSIIGAILNAQVKEDHVHPLVRARYKKLVEAGHRNESGLPDPSLEDLAEATKMTVERVQDTIQRVEIIFISDALFDDSHHDGQPYLQQKEVLVAQDNVESSAVVSAIQTSLVKTLEELPTVEQVIVAMRYYYNMNFSDIASELHITSTEVSSHHRAAVTRIHGSIKAQAELAAS
jgi:RNA polymerase sigma factor (sigma-70 family)